MSKLPVWIVELISKSIFCVALTPSQQVCGPQLGEHPFHPPHGYKFPVTKIGSANRKVHADWFIKWPWLHYEASKDKLHCFYCTKASQRKLLLNTKTEPAFTENGFSDWKKACEKFEKHAKSDCHGESVEKLAKNSSVKDIGEVLSKEHEAEKEKSRHCLLKILDALVFLSRQSIALRKGKDEINSNFQQTLKLLAKGDPILTEWLERKRENFTSHSIQNELLEIMAHHISRDITSDIRENKWFAYMTDETTDVSNLEQAVSCLRWVDSKFEVHEDYLEMTETPKTDSDTLLANTKDFFLRHNLPMTNSRGQCYDGEKSF